MSHGAEAKRTLKAHTGGLGLAWRSLPTETRIMSDLRSPNLAAQAVLDLELRSQVGDNLSAREAYEYEQLLHEIRADADSYVKDWIGDPSALVAHLFEMCAQPQDDHAEAWRRLVRVLFMPQVRAVARYKAEQSI